VAGEVELEWREGEDEDTTTAKDENKGGTSLVPLLRGHKSKSSSKSDMPVYILLCPAPILGILLFIVDGTNVLNALPLPRSALELLSRLF